MYVWGLKEERDERNAHHFIDRKDHILFGYVFSYYKHTKCCIKLLMASNAYTIHTQTESRDHYHHHFDHVDSRTTINTTRDLRLITNKHTHTYRTLRPVPRPSVQFLWFMDKEKQLQTIRKQKKKMGPNL